MYRAIVLTLLAGALTGCFDDRVGLAGVEESPHGEFVFVSRVWPYHAADLDLLLVIDNSGAMDSKQQLLADMAPSLLAQLLAPRCVSRDETEDPFTIGRYDTCPDGFYRRGNPYASVHVGVITTSLGGLGEDTWCQSAPSPEGSPKADMAHLLGSLPRGRAAAPSLNAAGFFALDEHSDLETAGRELAALIMAAGTDGCSMEAPLEAWVRFLVDPNPYAAITKRPCTEDDEDERCIGPDVDSRGSILVDQVVLEQRKAFLRPYSEVSIVMLSDENDCSMNPNGFNNRLMAPFWVPRASSACQSSGDDACCQPCMVQPLDGCPSETREDGVEVAQGCSEGSFLYDSIDVTLQCFDQQRRFGWEGLYPIERYTGALSYPVICPASPDLHPTRCEQPVSNPLVLDYDAPLDPSIPNGDLWWRRTYGGRLVAITGVPWQDLAVDIDADESLRLRDTSKADWVDWSLVLADPTTGEPPLDPLMIESIEPREGIHPITEEKLAPPRSGPLANSINGHEYDPRERDGLQYACIFPLQEPVTCPDRGERVTFSYEADGSLPPERLSSPNTIELTEGTATAPALADYFDEEPVEADAGVSSNADVDQSFCPCSHAEHDDYMDPLCQAKDGSYSRVQHYAGAEPGVRQLQLLEQLGSRGIAAPICPKSDAGPDRGYQPLQRLLFDEFFGYDDQDERFRPLCLRRAIPRTDDSTASCALVEMMHPQVLLDYGNDCAAIPGREQPKQAIVAAAVEEFENVGACDSPDECSELMLCEVIQLKPGDDGFEACKGEYFGRFEGWCPLFRPEDDEYLERCHPTVQSGLRLPVEPSRLGALVMMCAGQTGL